jgi:hypothetical protein
VKVTLKEIDEVYGVLEQFVGRGQLEEMLMKLRETTMARTSATFHGNVTRLLLRHRVLQMQPARD